MHDPNTAASVVLCPQVTSLIAKEVAGSLQGVTAGLAHIFIQHTSASLTINENACSGGGLGPAGQPRLLRQRCPGMVA